MNKCHDCGAPTTETVTILTIPDHVEREVPMCDDCKKALLEALEDE